MRVAFKTFLAHFFDVLILNTKFEIEENMGSKISVQDIDRQAEIHAKANFMKQLKEHHQNLEKENKELKQRNEFLENELKEIKELDDK